MITLKLIWSWINKHLTFIGAALLALTGFLFGVSVKKKPVIITGEDPEQKKIEISVEQQEHKLQQQAEQQKTDITEQHQSDVQTVVTKEQNKVSSLESNTTTANDYLKEIGQEIQEGKNG